MDTAWRETVSCKTLSHRSSHSASRVSNTADGRFSPCPKGVTEARHCRVAALAKGATLTRELRLALTRFCDSESIMTPFKEYKNA